MIQIIQTCDRCGDIRYLDLNACVIPGSLKHVASIAGWREVKENKHLCALCINMSLSST